MSRDRSISTGRVFSSGALWLLLASSAAWAADDPAVERSISFNTAIRPLLSEHCFACHGPDAAARKADLRLDRREDALTGELIIPGSAKTSELITRITSSDPELVMPPPETNKPLTEADKALLARWIDAGAKWEEHWAFVAPRRPSLPDLKADDDWTQNPIDHFVLKRLRETRLRPNPPANRHTLARRVALDLTGLPPPRRLLDTFTSDSSEHAYERYIDALLSSPHAGEHRARFWLDAARYGDTHGMHVDNYREIWPYRDWVIDAFNSNMPFDRFVIEQIAGDLLPESTLAARIATGFNRCNVTTAEGGSIPEEVNVRYMVDRVETTATVFLGLTAGCAVCHNHKYDPITQREFYQLGAFFNNTTQPAMDGNQKDSPPVAVLPAAAFGDEWEALRARRSQLQAQLSSWKSSASSWWDTRAAKVTHPVTADELALWLPLAGDHRGVELPASATAATDHPEGARGIRFGTKEGFDVEFDAPRSDEPLTVSFWYRTPDRVISTTIFDQSTKTEDDKEIGWKIGSTTQGGVSFEVFDGKGNTIKGFLPGEEALTPRAWQHVCARYSGGQSNSSIEILVNGRSGTLRNSSERHIDAVPLATIPLKLASDMETAGLSDVRIFRRWLNDDEIRLLAQEHALRSTVTAESRWEDLSGAKQQLVSSFYNHTLDPKYQALCSEIAAGERRRDYIYARSTTTLVMQENPVAPRAFVLERGEYDKRLEEVAADVPSVLPRLPAGAPRNRLGLAQWLVDRRNPLTARVTINRLWQSLFGTGIVKTSEDFGVMGAPPSHPNLLDWLAVELIESGWDVNHMLRLIVTSATYRQDGSVTQKKFEVDPNNRLLARGPRLRLDAEVLRDQALAVSGLLRPDVGGPSVRPYQPAGLWKVVAITGSNTGQFKQDTGSALYRRSLYTFWKRTSPPPSMAAFNAPTRESCTVRRERTNTPLQALVLMNDPQFVEAARHLAEHTLRSHDDDRARAEWMLWKVLSRPPSAADLKDVRETAAEFRKIFEAEPAAAEELLAAGESQHDAALNAVELAAWTIAANTLMNRDDYINKE